MASRKRNIPEWEHFERWAAHTEKDARPLGLNVTSPDTILCKITGHKREVGVSIRSRAGTTEVLITVECRKRHPKQDVTWIKQLTAKKNAIGAFCTVAVSSAGLTPNAEAIIYLHGSHFRRLSEVSDDEINSMTRHFGLFTHKRVARIALSSTTILVRIASAKFTA